MDADTRAKIEQGLRLARRIVPEYRLDRTFAQQTKTAIRRAAEEKGLDLGLERVSLRRERGDRNFEHLGSTRTIYLAFQEADHYQDEIFVFDAIGGEALTFITQAPAADREHGSEGGVQVIRHTRGFIDHQQPHR